MCMYLRLAVMSVQPTVDLTAWLAIRKPVGFCSSAIYFIQWHLFIIPNRAHQNSSKHAGNPTFSALVDLVVSNEMSSFEAKSMFVLVLNTIDQNWHFSNTLHRRGERVSPRQCNVWVNYKFWMLLFTKPNMLLDSNLDISLLTTRSTSAERVDCQHA